MIQIKQLSQDTALLTLTDNEGEHIYLSHEGHIQPLLDYDHQGDILLLHTEDYTLQLDYSY